MPLQRAILAVQQISLLPLGQPFQVIVQFPARFLFFHNGLLLHGVGGRLWLRCAAAVPVLPAWLLPCPKH